MATPAAVVLAAGKGTRMKSALPKHLHPICGKPMIKHIIDSLKEAGVPRIILVVGYGSEQVKQLVGPEVEYVLQEKQLGTGHAAFQAHKLLANVDTDVVVLNGDVPLLTPETISGMLSKHRETGAAGTMLSVIMEDPTGYGRVVRDDSSRVVAVIEEKDATAEQQKIKEINAGAYCFKSDALFSYLQQVSSDNEQNEYYLPEVFQVMGREGLLIETYLTDDADEAMGVNDRIQLAQAEKVMRERINRKLMLSGVIIIDPDSTFIDSTVEVGADTAILPFSIIEGETTIGEGATIGPHAHIKSSRIGNRVYLRQSVVAESEIGDDTTVGPFAYLRPGTEVGKGVRIGDFVETKKAKIGDGSKVPHHAYIGDGEIGRNANIGCGVIFVNYDGVKKHRTIVEDDAFVGCNTNLVAPIRVGRGSYIAAGSTITDEVPEGALGIARSRQVNKEGWVEKKRTKLKDEPSK